MRGQRHTQAALLPGKTWQSLNRRLDMPQGLSGRVRKMSPPRAFDPRTVQLIESRYTAFWKSLSTSQHYSVFGSPLLVIQTQRSDVSSEVLYRILLVPGKLQTTFRVGPQPSPSTPFPVNLSQIIILHYHIYKTEKLSLNKPTNDQNKQPHYLLTYLLTPLGRFLLEKLTGLQLVKKFPAFHGTRRFITALTSVRHLSLS